AAVLVATIRALKMHGGAIRVVPGKPLDKEALAKEDMEALDKGCENLDKQIENVLLHGVPVIVALNHFPTDTEREIQFVLERAKKAGASAAVVSKVWAEGGAGGIDLAKAV